jgi:hypothetical protein
MVFLPFNLACSILNVIVLHELFLIVWFHRLVLDYPHSSLSLATRSGILTALASPGGKGISYFELNKGFSQASKSWRMGDSKCREIEWHWVWRDIKHLEGAEMPDSESSGCYDLQNRIRIYLRREVWESISGYSSASNPTTVRKLRTNSTSFGTSIF